MTFRSFREWPSRAKAWQVQGPGMPGEGAAVQPLPTPPVPIGS